MSKPFLTDVVNLSGLVYVYNGTADPNTLVQVPTPTSGSLYSRTDGSLWENVGGGDTNWINTHASGDSDIFGDGSDGDLSVAGVTVETKTSDPYYNNLSIGAAGTYFPVSRRVFVRGTLTIAAGGLINAAGNAAVGSAGGTAGTGNTLVNGVAGGAGQAAAGAVGSSQAVQRGIPPSPHGHGGGGGAGSGGAGGLGGTITAYQTTTSGSRSALIAALAGGFAAPGIATAAIGNAAGCGGGGGGGNGVAAGGGGGGGGQQVLLIARRVITAGALPISAVGGAGAAGPGADRGGGGGGGGGNIIIVTKQYVGTALTEAIHAAGGAPGASGGGAGVIGTVGTNGRVLVLTI